MTLDDAIRGALHGDAQRNALDFVAFLRENGLDIGESETYWDIQLQGQSVCFLWVDGQDQQPGPWTIWSDQEPSGSWSTWQGADERTRETAWAHANPCASCGGDCSPGTRKAILGREFDGLCSSTLMFTNPDEGALDCAKQMVVMRIEDIRKA